MNFIQVERSPGLRGSVKIPGSKNSSLALLAAACLSDETVVLNNIPDIADFRVIREIADELGITMRVDEPGTVVIIPAGIRHAHIDPVKSATFRTAYYFVGALLSRCGTVSVGYPGGDNFGDRPIDQHIKALKALGAELTFHEKHYETSARQLNGADIYFDTITSGATINAMLAAVRAIGSTVLRNAARDPEVVDTAQLLIAMGARITGAGTDTIRIEGVRYLQGCSYTAVPDRLIAGSFLIAAGVTGGTITVEDVIPEHLGSTLAKLREIGLQIETNSDSITAYGEGPLRATRVRTGMYPGFPTDLQQPLTALMAQVSGKSIVTDKIYPKRFAHVQQLKRMGADIELRAGSAFIKGGLPLRGNLVHASDIRAGICLLLAGLAAEGTTRITGVYHFERGYENIVDSFRSLGAKLEVREALEAGIELPQVN
ncbi:UDP-N-acetylglucosamine 1-carboxyvinyltransferase [Paenibacillus paeoniae]|uniref:UDP-N-acetylglucosamine 1-carboxyvinyltransferase n=1 Tax=Paenibacillus paeoniae TaxID=2292705 RepID=A0A371PMM5_9BACL|nr:UDP-N-acetylglucosamine 1-carboxyvinyltransferase [Paenibacillus paeoniae]REK77450.1 UDP-N-acetylglucosamine 1-carboxyvinyltransferase [Paenibacillus paeoniae]